MKLRVAIELGILCGYKTIDACISNAEHLIGFLYPECVRESRQLYDDYEKYRLGILKLDFAEIKSNATKYMENYVT